MFLISLKAGGVGLNLTGADTVIHYDPWWNPAVMEQASDRAYRIGQTKAVQVIRLAAKGTIEEKILKLQENKKNLADDIVRVNTDTFFRLSLIIESIDVNCENTSILCPDSTAFVTSSISKSSLPLSLS